VRENILDDGSYEDLQLLVVWMPMLATDAREEVDTDLFEGERVREFWDGERVLGTHLARLDLGGLGYAGVVWDAFLVFGPGGRWAERPTGLTGSGAPVIAETAELEAALERTGA
jgi:hypothetical protein